VVQSAGLLPEDVSLSVESGTRDAHVLVHMRQVSRLLQDLQADPKQASGLLKELQGDPSFRITVGLPKSVAGVTDMMPETLGSFFVWRLNIADNLVSPDDCSG
jgi:hypothetical protein